MAMVAHALTDGQYIFHSTTHPPPKRSSVSRKPLMVIDERAFYNSFAHTQWRCKMAKNNSMYNLSHCNLQNAYKTKCDDDKRIKVSRAWSNAYELSQDLHDKQLEMLERKYGGHLIAKRAAKVIQQAFRHYTINKKFEHLRTVTNEKRLSKHFGLERSNTIWTDLVIDKPHNNAGKHLRRTVTGPENFDSPQFEDVYTVERNTEYMGAQHTNDTDDFETKVRISEVASMPNSQNPFGDWLIINEELNESNTVQKELEVDNTHLIEAIQSFKESDELSKFPSSVISAEENYKLTSCKENDNYSVPLPYITDSSSSSSDISHETLLEATVDLPSVNFESMLEAKEADTLNSSFNTESEKEFHIADLTSSQTQVMCPHHEHLLSVLTNTAEVVSSTQEYGVNPSLSDSVDKNMQCSAALCEHVTTMISSDCLMCGQDNLTSRTKKLEIIMCDTSQVRLRNKKKVKQDGSSKEKCNVDPHTGHSAIKASILQQSMDLLHPTKLSPEASPIWKRKSANLCANVPDDVKRMSNISEASEPSSVEGLEDTNINYENRTDRYSGATSTDTSSIVSSDSHVMSSGSSGPVPDLKLSYETITLPKLTSRQHKRLYRIGLNLFNKKPEKGMKYLLERRFVSNQPAAVAKFLISRKGLSKQMIGEFLGNLQRQFNLETLKYFVEEIDLSNLQIDVALRVFQSYFRMPGEAQKIERLMEAFAHRYCNCNPDQVKKFHSDDTVFLLAFAIIMLNTDLHNTSVKPERKMKANDFIKNMRGIDGGEDIDQHFLLGIYERIKAQEFKPGADHVSQVLKVEQTIVGKRPQLSLPHRRLVCYCRLYEVHDPNKREKVGLHQREVFLFNDTLMITKIFSKKKQTVLYSLRQMFPLCGMQVYLFETMHYKHGIRLRSNIDGKVLMTFNARNEHDRSKFVEDLREAILEMNEMEALRIEEELQKQKYSTSYHSSSHTKNSAVGSVDLDFLMTSGDPGVNRLSAPECGSFKKSNLSNSLSDLSDSTKRRISGGSLDSGMHSASSGSTTSREEKPAISSTSRFASIFGLKSKPTSSSKHLKSNISGCSEV